jgi:hypothetical protein
MPKPLKPTKHGGLSETIRRVWLKAPANTPPNIFGAHYLVPEMHGYLLRKLKLPADIYKKAQHNLVQRERILETYITGIQHGKVPRATAAKAVEDIIENVESYLATTRASQPSGAEVTTLGRLKAYSESLKNGPPTILIETWVFPIAEKVLEENLRAIIGKTKFRLFDNAERRATKAIQENAEKRIQNSG